MSQDMVLKLVIRLRFLHRHHFQPFQYLIEFLIYDRIVYFFLVCKIGIQGSAPFLGCFSNVVHGNIFFASGSKELPGNFNEHFFRV